MILIGRQYRKYIFWIAMPAPIQDMAAIVPMVAITCNVVLPSLGKDSFQEVDIVGITRSITKYAVTVQKREDLAYVIQEAFYAAKTGKPGVAVVDLPKDIQRAFGSGIYPAETAVREERPDLGKDQGRLDQAAALLARCTTEETSHLSGVLQKPEASAYADKALEDYIQIILRSAEKRRGEQAEDPLQAAVEKFRADKKKKGNGGKRQ